MTLPTFHIWHDTPRGRKPFTLFVFGPYSDLGPTGQAFDVEVYHGHQTEETRDGHIYIGTVSDLSRSTHVIADVWDWMNENV